MVKYKYLIWTFLFVTVFMILIIGLIIMGYIENEQNNKMNQKETSIKNEIKVSGNTIWGKIKWGETLDKVKQTTYFTDSKFEMDTLQSFGSNNVYILSASERIKQLFKEAFGLNQNIRLMNMYFGGERREAYKFKIVSEDYPADAPDSHDVDTLVNYFKDKYGEPEYSYKEYDSDLSFVDERHWMWNIKSRVGTKYIDIKFMYDNSIEIGGKELLKRDAYIYIIEIENPVYPLQSKKEISESLKRERKRNLKEIKHKENLKKIRQEGF